MADHRADSGVRLRDLRARAFSVALMADKSKGRAAHSESSLALRESPRS
jgi:hypothetical protein